MQDTAARQLALLKHATRANRMLAVMPKDALERLLPDIEQVKLVAGDVLSNVEGGLQHAYFPIDVIVTVLVLTAGRETMKVAVIGREGMTGVPILMGNASPHRSLVVLNNGDAFKIPIAALKIEFDRNGAVMRLILRFAQTLITQMAQNAVCSRHHLVEQQLCTWLLTCMDHMPTGNTLPVTQEIVAGLLGVRREGVTIAALKLQRAGLIHYRRGHMSIVDRAGIERQSCECYGIVKNAYAHVADGPGRNSARRAGALSFA